MVQKSLNWAFCKSLSKKTWNLESSLKRPRRCALLNFNFLSSSVAFLHPGDNHETKSHSLTLMNREMKEAGSLMVMEVFVD